MFMYFPENYPWSMAVLLAANMGGVLSEMDEACAALKPHAATNDANANELWFQQWTRIAARAEAQADADAANSHAFTAARKYKRAAIYHMTAERQARAGDPRKVASYRKMLACFARGTALAGDRVERIEVPSPAGDLPALYVPAAPGTATGRGPAIVHMDGLDVMKEFLFLSGVAEGYARRGIAVLLLDHPGIGEALRLRNLRLTPEVEVPAGAAFDWLQKRAEIDPKRIGVAALSLGGYYAPRVAACDTRFACCVAWGGIWDYGPITRARAAGGGSALSVSNWAHHMQLVFGLESMDDILAATDRMALAPVMDRLRCPLLVVHGENDRQIAVAMAENTIAAAKNSKRTELKLFSLAEGGAEHCQVDNPTLGADYIADWVAGLLGGRTA